ncbi:NAD(P)-dependent oxidoreductase [Pokkaliibacter sp. CJK22405]|uniref:NAD(P)-dependent oxidoreductase n=1 Tax=Pokkaliibacter sp. CJK22405 TaxID=3384615 RepID=UPI003984A4CD
MNISVSAQIAVKGCRSLVMGGGEQAAQLCQALLAEGAHVYLGAPELDGMFDALLKHPNLHWIKQGKLESILRQHWQLVGIATESEDLDALLAQWAEECHLPLVTLKPDAAQADKAKAGKIPTLLIWHVPAECQDAMQLPATFLYHRAEADFLLVAEGSQSLLQTRDATICDDEPELNDVWSVWMQQGGTLLWIAPMGGRQDAKKKLNQLRKLEGMERITLEYYRAESLYLQAWPATVLPEIVPEPEVATPQESLADVESAEGSADKSIGSSDPSSEKEETRSRDRSNRRGRRSRRSSPRNKREAGPAAQETGDSQSNPQSEQSSAQAAESDTSQSEEQKSEGSDAKRRRPSSRRRRGGSRRRSTEGQKGSEASQSSVQAESKAASSS